MLLTLAFAFLVTAAVFLFGSLRHVLYMVGAAIVLHLGLHVPAVTTVCLLGGVYVAYRAVMIALPLGLLAFLRRFSAA